MTVTTLLNIETIPYEEYTDDNKEEYIASIAVSMKRTADYLESMNKILALLVSVQAPSEHIAEVKNPRDSFEEDLKKHPMYMHTVSDELDDEIPF